MHPSFISVSHRTYICDSIVPSLTYMFKLLSCTVILHSATLTFVFTQHKFIHSLTQILHVDSFPILLLYVRRKPLPSLYIQEHVDRSAVLIVKHLLRKLLWLLLVCCVLYMGASFSGLTTRENIASDPSKPGLGDLPESCVALVLSFLETSEICRLALVNRTFRRASSADTVWESKLPENYEILVKKILGECPESLSKKQIYARLCCRNRFVDDNKEVWLEKNGGRVCVSISWKGLKITGIDDRRRWSHISTDESRFHTVAYLQETWWLEVQGDLDFEFPEGTYSLFFRLHVGRPSKRRGRRVCDLDQVHGWNIKPVQFQLSSSDGWQVAADYYLDEPGKWIHYHVGDFVAENSSMPSKLKFSMTQIDCTHNKGGLCLDSVLICPYKLGERLKCLRVCELENYEIV